MAIRQFVSIASETQQAQSLSAEIGDETLRELMELAVFMVQDEDKAIRSVARAVANLPRAAAAQIDNRRTRYKPKNGKRASYRPLTGRRELLHYLLLDELDEAEMEEERAGRLQGSNNEIRCFVKQAAKVVLNHNSWYAAVMITQILGTYTAQTTLDIYDLVASDRSGSKDLSSVSVAKESFVGRIMQRFGDRLDMYKDGPSWRFISRKPTPEEVSLISECLSRFLPQESKLQLAPVLQDQLRKIESDDEMARIRKFFNMAKFNELGHEVGVKPLQESMMVPIFDGVTPAGPGSSQLDRISVSNLDLDRLKAAISRESSRSSRLASNSLYVVVDGVERATLDAETPICRLLLERGANIVKLVEHCHNDGHEDKKNVLATYVLTYDDEPKTEQWIAEIPGFGKIDFEFEYRPDGTVGAMIGSGGSSGSLYPEWNIFAPLLPHETQGEEGTIAPSTVFITGTPGSGKSTMLAALISYMYEHHLVVNWRSAFEGSDGQWKQQPSDTEKRGHESSGLACTAIDISTSHGDIAFLEVPDVQFGPIVKEMKHWPSISAVLVVDPLCYSKELLEAELTHLMNHSIEKTLIVITKIDVLEDQPAPISEMKREIEYVLQESPYKKCGPVICLSARDLLHGENKWDSSIAQLYKVITRFSLGEAMGSLDYKPQKTAHIFGAKNLGVTPRAGQLHLQLLKWLLVFKSLLQICFRTTPGSASSVDENVAQQSQILQMFLYNAKRFEIPEDPAPRIYVKHDRISRVAFWVTGIATTALGALVGAELSHAFNVSYEIPIILCTFASSSAALIQWRFGWSRRLYKKYRSAELAIMRTSALMEYNLEEAKTSSFADWRGFSTARALWVWLGVQDHRSDMFGNRLTDFLCALGTEPTAARRISTVINASQSHSLNNKELASIIVSELELPSRAAWALESLKVDLVMDNPTADFTDDHSMHNKHIPEQPCVL